MNSAKFTIETDRNKLRAALIFAADKDIRFYLNSVCLHVDECGGARLVATDGHRLAIITLGDYPAAAPGEYLIPRDAIKAIKKASGRSFNGVNVEIDADRFTLSAYDEIIGGGKLIDGKFPDFQRVTPANVDDWSGQAATFNADYLHDIKRALIELGDKNGFFTMAQNGPNNAGVAVRADKGFLCVVMAMRGDDMPSAGEISGFMPRRMPRAIIETASGGGAFPCDPLQDVGDKRGAVDAGQAAPVAHCAPDVADWIDPAGTMRAAGLLIVAHVGDKAPAAAPLSVRTVLASGVNKFGNPIDLIHATAGEECAGAGTRSTGEKWGALFVTSYGVHGGAWFKTETEARARFEELTQQAPAAAPVVDPDTSAQRAAFQAETAAIQADSAAAVDDEYMAYMRALEIAA